MASPGGARVVSLILRATTTVALVAVVMSAGGAPSGAAQTHSAPVCRGVLRIVSTTDTLREAISDVNAGRLPAGSVIRLQPGTYRLEENGPPLSFKNVTGTSEDCPVVLEGSGARTVVDGARDMAGHYFRQVVSGRSGLDQIEFVEREDAVPGIPADALPREDLVNCFKIKRASWIVIRHLAIRNCWPSALFIRDASYITVTGLELTGATYAIAIFGRSHHILVEETRWDQDPSGKIWSDLPWGVVHHGSRGYLNGALVGGKNLSGSIVIRDNFIRNAFNGVRIKSAVCRTPVSCDRNLNVEIYGNTFEFIRDNPIEPEGYASNWWVHHNRIRNAHAWFSLNGVYGGPHFIFANTGWFDDVPGRGCDESKWAHDVNPAGVPTTDKDCAGHRLGKVLKLGNSLGLPTYVFHNSWYLRSPLTGGGRSGRLRHWNNAIAFCEPKPDDEVCLPTPFFSEIEGDSFDGAKITHSNYRIDDHEFRNDMSNHPDYPKRLSGAGYLVHGRYARDLGFADPARGDFRLTPESQLRGAGCALTWIDTHALACGKAPADRAADIGAFQGDRRLKGPSFRHRDPPGAPDTPYVERPRIVGITWPTPDAKRLILSFSVPIAHASRAARVELALKGPNEMRVGRCLVADTDPWSLTCDVPGEMVDEATVEQILLPRDLVRRDGAGARVTLWAAPDNRLGFFE